MGLSAAYTTVARFVESFFRADPVAAAVDANRGWGDWEARRSRYAVYWGHYRNDVFRRVNSYAAAYKREYGLDEFTRGCYSPAARLSNFWRAHLMGGSLDPAAGDGAAVPSALPIEGEGVTDAHRKAIARLWWQSNWQVKKGVYTLFGPVLGDVFLAACDDPSLKSMLLDVWHPADMKWVRKDDRGDITAYVRQQQRRDPRQPGPTAGPFAADTGNLVTFTEIAEADGGKVHYRTYLGGALYPWNGAKAEWDADFGFIPVYHVPHIDSGMGWGESEFESGRAGMIEVDDLGSRLHDQIRRMVLAPKAITADDPARRKGAVAFARTAPTAADPEAPRMDQRYLWLGQSDRPMNAFDLTSNMSIADVSAEVRQQLDALEDIYPELRFERLRTGGQVSGAALRVARQPAAQRVEERRAGYDYALMSAQSAALAIGGHLNYSGYEGFSLDSYSPAQPGHRIGQRPVFTVEPADRVEESTAEAAAVKAWVDGGVPLPEALAQVGWSTEAIDRVTAAVEADHAAAAGRQAAMIRAEQMGGIQ